jgi:hypothetical protein
MAAVEVDPKKVEGVNLANLGPDDVKKVLMDAQEDALEESKKEDVTLNLAALGGAYKVGPLDITVALGNLVLLNEINSPFISGEIGEEGEALDTMECFKAIYVLAKGREAIRPIMAIKQRIQNMMMLEKMVKGNPDLFRQLMDRVEKISEAEKEFEESASDFYRDNFVDYDFQEVVNSVFLALSDISKTSQDLPTDDEKDGVKKK